MSRELGGQQLPPLTRRRSHRTALLTATGSSSHSRAVLTLFLLGNYFQLPTSNSGSNRVGLLLGEPTSSARSSLRRRASYVRVAGNTVGKRVAPRVPAPTRTLPPTLHWLLEASTSAGHRHGAPGLAGGHAPRWAVTCRPVPTSTTAAAHGWLLGDSVQPRLPSEKTINTSSPPVAHAGLQPHGRAASRGLARLLPQA